MKLETFNLPASWACALLYGDQSGLDESEIAAIEGFESAAAGPDGTFICVDVQADETDFMTWHDARAFYPYAADCGQFTFDTES